jgi:hypothetical protein
MATKKKDATATKAPARAITKIEAVRRAMAALGPAAKRSQLKAHIKKQFGIDMSSDHVAVSRRVLRKRQAAQARSATTAPVPTTAPLSARAAVSPSVQPAAARKQKAKKSAARTQVLTSATLSPTPGLGISLDDIEAVKTLLERVDATSLRRLIDVLVR